MRNSEEMMKLILDVAQNDERIRAVTMEGSRASKNATHDQYCDFDISYVVNDIRQFTKDSKWIEIFGEILIVQYPMDWYSHPYDYTGRDNFAYLIQFKDGNRIDLTLIDISNIEKEQSYCEPRIVLLNKDDLKELKPISDESVFNIQKPSEMEFYNTCNEFRWLSIYITKGLCRKEIYYAKYAYDVLMMEMFIKMLNWKIGVDHDFNVTTGDHSKYLKRFLSSEEMERFQGVFPNGTYEDIWNKLYVIYDFFAEIAKYVGGALGYSFDAKETEEVRMFLLERQKQSENKKTDDTNGKPESNKKGRGKIISILSQLFVTIWVGVFALWTKPFMADYYQKMANSHYDSLVQWIQMGPVFVAAVLFSIHSFAKKRYFVGVLTMIIAIWSYYWTFLAGPFYCHDCTYGG